MTDKVHKEINTISDGSQAVTDRHVNLPSTLVSDCHRSELRFLKAPAPTATKNEYSHTRNVSSVPEFDNEENRKFREPFIKRELNLNSLLTSCRNIKMASKNNISKQSLLDLKSRNVFRSNYDSTPYLGYDLKGKKMILPLTEKMKEEQAAQAKDQMSRYSTHKLLPPFDDSFLPSPTRPKKNRKIGIGKEYSKETTKLGRFKSGINKSSSFFESMSVPKKDKESSLMNEWSKLEEDLKQKQAKLITTPIPINLSKFFRLSFLNPQMRTDEGRRQSIRTRTHTSVAKPKSDYLPDGLKTFVDYYKAQFDIRITGDRMKLLESLSDYFKQEICKFMDSFRILTGYEVETIFLEATLSNYIKRFVEKDFHESFTDALVKENKLKSLPESIIKQKVTNLKKDYFQLSDAGRQWAFLQTFQRFGEIANVLVYEIKTRHYEKLKIDVKREFSKYKEKHKEFLVSKQKFTVFRQDMRENHEMIKAARKFNTTVGKFDIMTYQEQMNYDGLNIGDPSSKTFKLNKHIRKVVEEFAKLE